MTTVSASVARQTLPAQLDRVEAGEQVEITRHGRVVAVLVRPEVLAARRAPELWARTARIGAWVEAAGDQPLHPPALSPDRAEELVAQLQADRSER